MKNRSSKATKIRYLLTEEYSTSEIAEMVGSSSRWVRACRARVRRPPSRYAVLLAQVIGLRGEVARLALLVEKAKQMLNPQPKNALHNIAPEWARTAVDPCKEGPGPYWSKSA